MLAFTPQLQLETLFVLNPQGRIVSTREPEPSPGPRFALIRGVDRCAWAVHADLSHRLATQVEHLARHELPSTQFRQDPLHAPEYRSLLGDQLETGPAFVFPNSLPRPSETILVTQLAQLEQNFRGWSAAELPERSPIVALAQDGQPVSICFCARRTFDAAEAGVETVERFRRRGLGSRVTGAWALAIRSSGRLPIYSTSWTNAASLAVARKLGLIVCANDWSLYAEPRAAAAG